MFLQKRVVSTTFRNIVIQEYPQALLSPAYMEMLQHLLFSSFRDRETGGIIISRGIVARIEGKRNNGKYSAEKFLKDFQRNVLPTFTWYNESKKDGRARTVKNKGLSEKVMNAATKELLREYTDNRVYFVTGEKPSKRKQQEFVQEVKLYVFNEMKNAGVKDAADLLEYLNNLPPNTFTKLTHNLNKAYALAGRIRQETKREYQLRVLHALEQQLQPFYAPVERSVRVFPVNESMNMLHREIRKVLCAGWTEFDLRNAQLAIVQKLWNIPDIAHYLKADKSIWHSFYKHYEVDDTYTQKLLKPYFKTALYATCYGMDRGDISRMLTNELKLEGLYGMGPHFMKHPLIVSILEARERYMSEVMHQGGAFDAYGRWIPTDTFDVKSVLAQQAQSYELKVLFPVIPLARANKDFSITLWQHDGFSVSFVRDKEYWRGRVIRTVNEELQKLGILTILEHEELESNE